MFRPCELNPVYLQVLLGEGYYAERTSKQTIEILRGRGNDLESQIETLNAIIKDLKFEASFFDETATEAAVSSPSFTQMSTRLTS